MGIRSIGRDTPELDRVFCYFMETLLRIRRSGVAELPLPVEGLPEPCRGYLEKTMELFLGALPPELFRLLLEAERDAAAQGSPFPVNTCLCLRLIGELAWHIRCDEDPAYYLMSLENLWGREALAYANRVFYPAFFGGDPAGIQPAKEG